MKNYRLSSWKLQVTGLYATEEEAIKDLSDKYMQCSKCDPPGEHFLELFSGSGLTTRKTDGIAKRVYFYVEEKVYGNLQMVHKLTLNIHPFKQEHWWDSINKENPFIFPQIEFKYEIIQPETQV